MVAKFSLTTSTKEKRINLRKLTNARVKVSHSTFGIIRTRTRDISDKGVFVSLKDKPHLPIGAHIKMQFMDSALPELAFNMKVIRNEEDGVALLFIDFELNGQRYDMSELSKHWLPSKTPR